MENERNMTWRPQLDSIQIGSLINQQEELNVLLETSSGFGFEGKVISAKIDMDTDFYYDRPIGQSWDLTLTGIGPPFFAVGIDIAKRIATRFLPMEWVCKFCERANPIDQNQCQSCGWYRGIIADVVQEVGIWRPK